MTTFEIPGRPVPKGRPRFTSKGTTYTPTATRAAQNRVGWLAYEAGFRPVAGRRYSVEMDFYVTGNYHADGDNLEKLIADGLQSGGEFNDRQIRRCTWRIIDVEDKEDEKTVVTIREAL